MPKVKVLFLDMDGVLCTTRSHKAYARQFFMQHLDPVAVRLLERALQHTKSELVLSSTWREHYSKNAMTCILMNSGFEKEPPWHNDWKTPVLPTRGREISRWLDINPVAKYAIIDDNHDFLEDQIPFFIKTDECDGLMWQHYERILSLLS